MTASSAAHLGGQSARPRVVPSAAALGAEIQGLDLARLDEYAAQVEGHRPYEAPDARSRPAHPRAGRYSAVPG